MAHLAWLMCLWLSTDVYAIGSLVIYTQDQRPVAARALKFKQAWRNEFGARASERETRPQRVPLKETLIKALLFV